MLLLDALQQTGQAKQAQQDLTLSCKMRRERDYLLQIWEDENLTHILDFVSVDEILAFIQAEDLSDYESDEWEVSYPLHVTY